MPLQKYEHLKALLLSDELETFSELLKFVDQTPFARDARTTPERLNRMLANFGKFKLEDISHMAEMIGVDDKLILALVHNEFVMLKKKKS